MSDDPVPHNSEDLNTSKRSSVAPTLRDFDPAHLGDASPVTKKELHHKVDVAEPKDLIVSWDGPDDPENPKKCVLRLIHAFQIVMNLSWQLAYTKEVDGDGHGCIIHIYISCIIQYDRTSQRESSQRIWDHERYNRSIDNLCLCIGIWYVSISNYLV